MSIYRYDGVGYIKVESVGPLLRVLTIGDADGVPKPISGAISVRRLVRGEPPTEVTVPRIHDKYILLETETYRVYGGSRCIMDLDSSQRITMMY